MRGGGEVRERRARRDEEGRVGGGARGASRVGEKGERGRGESERALLGAGRMGVPWNRRGGVAASEAAELAPTR